MTDSRTNVIWEYLKRFDRWILQTPKRRAIYWLISALAGTLTVLSILRSDSLGFIGTLAAFICGVATVVMWFRAFKFWHQYTNENRETG